MQIVINIPKSIYQAIRYRSEGRGLIECNSKAMANAINYGIPLPEEHGRMIDADKLFEKVKTECNPYGKPTIDFESGSKVLKMINNAPTIIERKGE